MGSLRALLLTVLLLATACGEPVTRDDPGADAPTEAQASPPALFIPVTEPDHRDPVVRSGAAGAALRCDGPVANGGTASNFGGPPGGATPEAGLALFTEQGLFQVPRDGYREAARDEKRVLYVFEVASRPRVAAVVAVEGASDQTMHEEGWGLETFAMCDPSEYGLPPDDHVMGGVWYDQDGKALPTSVVMSHEGPEHCDWQSVTFLYLGGVQGRQFARDPEGKLTAQLRVPYDGGTSLPDGAEDTGYRKDGVALWRTPSGDAVYAVKGDVVERWPAMREIVACA